MQQLIMKEIQKDISLSDYGLETLPLIQILREEHFADRKEVCIERAWHLTKYMRDLRPVDEDMQVSRAKATRRYLSERQAVFPHDGNLLAGSTTSKALGAPLYPEFHGLMIWPELETISARDENPQLLTREEIATCNEDIFPFWMDWTPLEVVRREHNNPECLKLMEKIVYFLNGKGGCISHCIPSYREALDKGLLALIKEAADRRKDLEKKRGREDLDRALCFYAAVEIALRGILDYAQNLAIKAREKAKTEWVRSRRKNYLAMAEVCDRVPAYPPRTYREAVNALWLCQVGIHAENNNMAMSPGRLDQVLYPYFEADVRDNNLSLEEALEISSCLWLKLADNVNVVPEASETYWGGAGSTPAVTLGGVNREGKDAVNDLTYIFLKVTEMLKLRDPNVNARYHYDVNDRCYRDRVSEVILNTRAIPAFHNDAADIDTLKKQGLQEEDARDFGIVGCVELAGSGCAYVASSSIILNLCAAMDLAMTGGSDHHMGDVNIPATGDPGQFRSFGGFRTAFETQLRWLIGQAVDLNELLGEVHQRFLPTPLLSALFDGPLETGKDLIDGGARYNSSGATHVGFADVCDSLNAVEDAVFKKRKLTMEDMAQAVASNFGAPYDKEILPYLKNKTPKFGTDCSIAERNAKHLIELIYDEYQRHTPTYRGGDYRPAYWTMTFHAGFGTLSGALPSGRKKGQYYSSGITPVSQGSGDLSGVYCSVAKLPSTKIPGGEALNIKYTPRRENQNKDRYLATFGDRVESYFRDGGMQVQFNVLSYEDLEAAKDEEKYPELMVRVSGYSAYFKDLSEHMKEELIQRTQYDLQTGAPVSPPSTGGREMTGPIVNSVGKTWLPRMKKWLIKQLVGKAHDWILEMVLRALKVLLMVDSNFRTSNLKGFKCTYAFHSGDSAIDATAVFDDGSMKIRSHAAADADVTVIFKNSETVVGLLKAEKPDVFKAVLSGDLSFEGNFNYLLKLLYMLQTLRLRLSLIG